MPSPCHPWHPLQLVVRAHLSQIGTARLEAIRVGGSVLDVIWCDRCGGLVTYAYNESPQHGIPTEEASPTDREGLIQLVRSVTFREGGITEIDVSTPRPGTETRRDTSTYLLRHDQRPMYSIEHLPQPHDRAAVAKPDQLPPTGSNHDTRRDR